LHKILINRLPGAPDTPPDHRTVLTQAMALPEISPFYRFAIHLYALRAWWPVLVPVLALIGWRTYQRERQRGLTDV